MQLERHCVSPRVVKRMRNGEKWWRFAMESDAPTDCITLLEFWNERSIFVELWVYQLWVLLSTRWRRIFESFESLNECTVVRFYKQLWNSKNYSIKCNIYVKIYTIDRCHFWDGIFLDIGYIKFRHPSSYRYISWSNNTFISWKTNMMK